MIQSKLAYEHTKRAKKGTQTFQLPQASSGLTNFENFKFTKQAIPENKLILKL